MPCLSAACEQRGLTQDGALVGAERENWLILTSEPSCYTLDAYHLLGSRFLNALLHFPSTFRVLTLSLWKELIRNICVSGYMGVARVNFSYTEGFTI